MAQKHGLIFVFLSILTMTPYVVSLEYREINAPVNSVTIYGNDMAFIGRSSVIDLEGGVIELRIVNFTKPILDSILINDDNGAILEWYHHTRETTTTEYRNKTLCFNEILRDSIGKEISLRIYGNKTVEGELIWNGEDKIGINLGNGILFINKRDVKEMIIYGAVTEKIIEVNKTNRIPELIFKENSNPGTHNIEISYLAWGANWKPEYKFYTNSEEKRGRGTLQAWAIVTNNIEDWNNVDMKLVIGYPIVLYPRIIRPPIGFGGVRYALEKATAVAEAEYAPPQVNVQFTQEELGEFYIYTLSNKVTLKNGETRYLPLFTGEVEFNKKYFWDTRQGDTVYRVFEFTNSLPDPWAKGIFSIYINGNFQGQDRIDYVAKNDKVKVKVSKAPDINVKKQTLEKIEYPESQETIGHKIRYSRTTYYKVNLTIENFRDEEVEIEIKDYMVSGDQVNLKSSTIKPERIHNVLTWDLTLRSGEKKSIIYEYEVINWYYYR